MTQELSALVGLDAGGELVVELVAEVLELLLALPFLPRDSSSVCVAT